MYIWSPKNRFCELNQQPNSVCLLKLKVAKSSTFKHSTRNREFDASRNLIVFKMEEIGIKAEEAREDPVSSPSSQDVDSKNADLDDLYSKYKKLQQQLEFLQVQEEYIKV